MEASDQLDDAMRACVTACSDCHDVCMESAVYALHMDKEPEHLTLLLDCAEICDVSRDFMLSGSAFHTRTCGVCAEVCAACRDMCRSHRDALLQRCADQCDLCAASCRDMAARGGGDQ